METAKKKVLVVEDDVLLRATLVQQLERSGFTTLTADDGQKGLEMFKADAPDALVLDIMLPGKNGLEVLEEIRQSMPENKTPIIVLTNVDDMDSLSRAVAGDAVAYVIKSQDALDTVAAIVKNKLSATE